MSSAPISLATSRAGSCPVTLRTKLRLVTIAWVFGAFWVWTINGAVMNRFAKNLNMPDSGFGFLAALPYVGCLFQLPACYLMGRFGHRKALFMVTCTVARLLWALAAFIPWVLPGFEHSWWGWMLAVLLVSWALGNMATPPWMNWMADVIPDRIRGRYFAMRTRVGQMVGLVTTLGIGYVLDLAEGYVRQAHGQPEHSHFMLKLTSTILAISGLVGALDIQCFTRIPDDQREPAPEAAIALREMFAVPLRDKNFRRFLAYSFSINLAMGYIAQYAMVYLLDVAQVSNAQANTMLIAIPLLVMAVCVTFWGRVMDRVGKKPVLVITTALALGGGVGWFFIQPGHVLYGYLLALTPCLVWPGLEMATFNITLDMAGDDGPGTQKGAGASYVAMASLAVALGGICSGLLGSAVAGWLRDFRYAMPALGVVVTYHSILFLLSSALRVIPVVIAATIHEPKATDTREALRYVTDGVWSQVRQVIFVPGRIAGHVVRKVAEVTGGEE